MIEYPRPTPTTKSPKKPASSTGLWHEAYLTVVQAPDNNDYKLNINNQTVTVNTGGTNVVIQLPYSVHKSERRMALARRWKISPSTTAMTPSSNGATIRLQFANPFRVHNESDSARGN